MSRLSVNVIGARAQRGATLLVTMVMLVMLTLFVITGINLTTSNSKIVGNLQAKRQVDGVAQRVVDQVVTEGLFVEKRAWAVTPSWKPSGMTVQVTERVCKAAMPQIGDPTLASTVWEFDVCVRDTFTGAKSFVRQGITVKTINSGAVCPTPTAAYAATSC